MKEICIVFENKNLVCLDKLLFDLKQLGAIAIKLVEDNYTRLVCAIDNSKADYLEYILKCFLSTNVLTKFKKSFINSILHLENDIKSKVLLQCLINYDIEADKTYFLSKLDFNENIYINSFINFKLQLLINKWKEISTLTKENSTILDVESIFYSLIRFVSENGLSNSIIIDANLISNNLVEYDHKIFKMNDFLCYCAKISPKKIVFSKIDNNIKVNQLFLKLFDKKIEFNN